MPRFHSVNPKTGRASKESFEREMTEEEAAGLEEFLTGLNGITDVKVYRRTGDAVIKYKKERDGLKALSAISDFDIINYCLRDQGILKSRAINEEYQGRLANAIMTRAATRLLMPANVRKIYTVGRALPHIGKGLKSLLNKKIEVPVLDATAITVSMLTGDFDTAGSIMFLLGVGDILDDWTHKKSVDDLARSMALNVSNVWKVTEKAEEKNKGRQSEGNAERIAGGNAERIAVRNAPGKSVSGKIFEEELVDINTIRPGDLVKVYMGNIIPLDGEVEAGEALVNQASLTGESAAVEKRLGSSVYAGTVCEEGELLIRVREAAGATKYEQIVHMIEESEKLKSDLENKAITMANKLVPWSLAGTMAAYAITQNIDKALAVLMVDYSCALKLVVPITVLAAIKEGSDNHITIKGGKFLEDVANADTIVFDKTGTLTKAEPKVYKVISFNGESEQEMLRLAACLEEHFPHSVAKAVVTAASEKGLAHPETHSKVEYVVAHGIASRIGKKRVVLGSKHFVFDDEKCKMPKDKKALLNLPDHCSHLYMAIDGELAAVICVEDPLRPEAPDVIRKLHEVGFKRIIMMTGDSSRAAKAAAEMAGVDEYYSEVMPGGKAAFIKKQKADGHKVVMVGDGINDSPALSEADVGIAINEGAEIAREISDITINGGNLMDLVVLKELSDALLKKTKGNYRKIIGVNSALIGLGVTGVITPATSALLHNASTVIFGVGAMNKLLQDRASID